MKQSSTQIKGLADKAKLLNFIARLSYCYSRQAAQFLYGRTTDSAMRMMTRKLRKLEQDGLVKSQPFKDGKPLRSPDGQLKKSVNPAGCEKVYALTAAGVDAAKAQTSAVRSSARDVFSTVHDHRTQANSVLVAVTPQAQSWSQDELDPSFAILSEWECASARGGFDELQRRATYEFQSNSEFIKKRADLVLALTQDESTLFVWVEVENSGRSKRGMRELADFLTFYEMNADGERCQWFLFVITSPDARSMPSRLLHHLNGDIYREADVLDPRGRRAKEAAMNAYRRCMFRVLNVDTFTVEPMQSRRSERGHEAAPQEVAAQTADATEDDVDDEPEFQGGDQEADYQPDNDLGGEGVEESDGSGLGSRVGDMGQAPIEEGGMHDDQVSPDEYPTLKASQEEVGGLVWSQSYDDDEEADLWTAWHLDMRAVASVGQVVYLSIYDGDSEKELFGTRFESRQQAQLAALDAMIRLLP